jgi:hypothetical protein
MDKRNLPDSMSENAATLQSFDGECSFVQLERLSKRAWTGVARVRTSGAFGAVWFVKGNCVHAAVEHGQTSITGWKALERLSRWQKGAILLEKNVLPPERSIRLEQRVVWARLNSANTVRAGNADERNTSAASDHVKAVQTDIVNHFPGILYLSTTDGKSTAHTGHLDNQNRSWVRKCLDAFSDKREVKRLVVENRNQILLVNNTGSLQTVVVANAGTNVSELLSAMIEMDTQGPTKQGEHTLTESVR